MKIGTPGLTPLFTIVGLAASGHLTELDGTATVCAASKVGTVFGRDENSRKVSK